MYCLHVHKYVSMQLCGILRMCVQCPFVSRTLLWYIHPYVATAFLDMKTALSGYLPARPRKDPSKLASDSTRSLKQHSKSSLRAPSHSTLQQPSHSSLKAPSQSSLKAPSQSSLKAPSQSSLKEPSQTSLKGPSQGSLKAPSQISMSKVTAGKEEVEEEKAQRAGPGKEVSGASCCASVGMDFSDYTLLQM